MPESKTDAGKTERKANKGSFKPGQSGNPGGRKKRTPEEIDLIAACRQKTPQALAVVDEIMTNGEQEKNRLAAAQFVIERGWGKAVQPQEISGPGGEPVQHEHALRPQLSPEEWLSAHGIEAKK